MTHSAQDPAFAQKVRDLFATAPFIRDLGVVLDRVEPGLCDTSLAVEPRHGQQDGFVHAGVMATIADHTAGAAACSLARATETVLTIEFKINLLRPALGRRLRCAASVLRAGRTISVVESQVFASDGSDEKLVAKATVTLAIVALPSSTAARG